MNIEINFSKKAEKFLRKNTSLIKQNEVENLTISALKKLIYKTDINIDFKKLEGKLRGLYRIRKGKVRIILKIKNGKIIIVSIISIDFRGNVY